VLQVQTNDKCNLSLANGRRSANGKLHFTLLIASCYTYTNGYTNCNNDMAVSRNTIMKDFFVVQSNGIVVQGVGNVLCLGILMVDSVLL
jgi:hypothetical protein